MVHSFVRPEHNWNTAYDLLVPDQANQEEKKEINTSKPSDLAWQNNNSRHRKEWLDW